MVLFINRRTRCILLEVPNAVGWKLHFGLALSKNEDMDKQVAEAVAASGVKVESCVRTGVMLFTFRDCSEAPMRVSVYEASVDGGQTVGLFHAPEEIPYERMWADDKVWLPHILEEGPYYFSGHFVFSGPPPGKLVAHNCRGERGGLSFWE